MLAVLGEPGLGFTLASAAPARPRSPPVTIPVDGPRDAAHSGVALNGLVDEAFLPVDGDEVDCSVRATPRLAPRRATDVLL